MANDVTEMRDCHGILPLSEIECRLAFTDYVCVERDEESGMVPQPCFLTVDMGRAYNCRLEEVV